MNMKHHALNPLDENWIATVLLGYVDSLLQYILLYIAIASSAKKDRAPISDSTCLTQCYEMLWSPEKESKDLPEAPCAKSAVADRARSTRTAISVFIMSKNCGEKWKMDGLSLLLQVVRKSANDDCMTSQDALHMCHWCLPDICHKLVPLIWRALIWKDLTWCHWYAHRWYQHRFWTNLVWNFCLHKVVRKMPTEDFWTCQTRWKSQTMPSALYTWSPSGSTGVDSFCRFCTIVIITCEIVDFESRHCMPTCNYATVRHPQIMSSSKLIDLSFFRKPSIYSSAPQLLVRY
jgi:hypothetical protein